MTKLLLGCQGCGNSEENPVGSACKVTNRASEEGPTSGHGQGVSFFPINFIEVQFELKHFQLRKGSGFVIGGHVRQVTISVKIQDSFIHVH